MKEDITPRNNKGQPHGLWIYHFSNGIVWYKGQYINGIRHGYWISNWYEINPEIILYLK